MNPTSEQLSARLNPTPVQIQIPSQGLFRTVGDYGTTIYGTDSSSGKLAIYNLIGSNSPLFKDTADRASFGNAGGQAAEALRRLKDQYGIDWNSLNQVNLGDFMQQLRKNGIGYTDPDGAFTGYSVQGDFNSLRQQPLATLSSQTINNTPNTLATAQQITQQMSNPLWNSGINTPQNIQQASSGTPNNLNSQTQIGTPNVNQPISKPVPITALQPGMTGESVKQLQDYLVANGYMTQDQVNTGYGIYGPQTTSAVKALQEKLGVDNSTGVGFFGPKTISALQGNSMQSTPYGTINPNVPISLNTSNQNIFPSSVLGSKLTTEDVLNKTQSYNDLINSYLKQQADAQSQLNNVKMQQLQGMSSIRQSDSVLPLQGQDLAEFEKQMAFKQLPAEIALQNAQTGLALFKQSPQYLNEQQSRDTAFNLLQNYPDINYQYDPNISAQQNLQNIKASLGTSSKYQASLVAYKGYTDANGVFHLYNSKDISNTGVMPQGGMPTPNNPTTQSGTYIGTGSTTPITQVSAAIDKPVTRTQVDFVKDFNSGTLGKAKTALNTAVGHLFEADQLYQSLGNGNNQIWNSLVNTSKKITGNSGATNYETAQTLASNELATAYGGDSQADRDKLSQYGGSNQSPEQHKGYVQTATALLASKLGAIAEQYKGAFGHYPTMDALISPLNQVKLYAFTGLNLNGILPGVPVSPQTQAMIQSAQIVGGKVYLPDSQGNYQVMQ